MSDLELCYMPASLALEQFRARKLSPVEIVTAQIARAEALEPEDLPRADVVLLGEVHDNPAHHAFQAEAVAYLAPRALVFEMLTPAQAALVVDMTSGTILVIRPGSARSLSYCSGN